MKQWKIENIYNIYKIVFCPCKLQFATLNYYHSYIQLFMLNNDKRKIIHDSYRIFNCNKLHNDNITESRYL